LRTNWNGSRTGENGIYNNRVSRSRRLDLSLTRRQPRHFLRQLRPLLRQSDEHLASFCVSGLVCHIDAVASALLALFALDFFEVAHSAYLRQKGRLIARDT
jgi:hypothetical protein